MQITGATCSIAQCANPSVLPVCWLVDRNSQIRYHDNHIESSIINNNHILEKIKPPKQFFRQHNDIICLFIIRLRYIKLYHHRKSLVVYRVRWPWSKGLWSAEHGCPKHEEWSWQTKRGKKHHLIYIYIYTGWWLGPSLWKIWKSIGMISNPIYGNIKKVPNHQPVYIYVYIYMYDRP